MLRAMIALTGLLLTGLSALPAAAQAWPTKQVKVIVPFPAGGLVDSIARLTSERLGARHGQTFLVENKPGAGGTIGAAQAAAAAGDGSTLLLVLDTHAVNHHLYSGLTYDPFKSFAYVSRLVSSPQMVAASAQFAPKSLAELIAHAKAKPGEVTYGSIGAGSANHLNALLLEERAGIKMTHVPYKGGAPMIQDLLGGQINIAFLAAPTNLQHFKAGRLKPLAAGPAKRWSPLPEVASLAETMPGFEASSWVGLIVPASTPAALQEQIHKAYADVLKDAEVKGKLEAQGFDIVGSSPAEFLAFVQADSDRLGKVIRDNKVKVD